MKPLWELDVDSLDDESTFSNSSQANPYVDWAWSIFCWDGIVPVVIVSVPTLASLLFPRNAGVVMLLNVFLPIFAFFVRLAIANQRFERGNQYGWQVTLFFIAVFFLIFLDAILILFHTERGQFGRNDWHLLVVLYVFYLSAMAVAFFPLRYTLTSETEPADWNNNFLGS